MALLFGVTLSAHAQQLPDTELPSTGEQVIEPALEREDVKLPRIDTEDFEAGIYTGIYAVEDFGSDVLFGVALDYHVTEDIFFEITYGQVAVTDTTFRGIGLPVFSEENQTLHFYNAGVGYNILPGELFLINGKALTTHLFIVGAIGETRLDQDSRSTFSYGLGLRLLPTDWYAIRVDFRDHVYDMDLLGPNKTTHNTDAHLGLSIFF